MKKHIFILIALLIGLSSCSESDDSNTRFTEEIPEGTNLRVNYFTSTCQGLITQECMLIQEGEILGTKDWNFFYSGIEGFEYEAGFVYNLEIIKTTIENPPADGSSIKYELIRIISKEVVVCDFNNPVEDLDWLRFEIQQRELNPTEDMKYCYITQGEVNNKPVFLYWDCNPVINKVIPVHDCLGNVLSFLGGDTISIEDVKNQKIVWKPDGFLCNPSL